ncbi:MULTISPECIES: GNAT family N-acetyltransferase [Actinoalloteichus]|uniref:N-acetyltransferase domain-containing protein n=1 Tax=Actinoalloteichus fjordicus TaxID=1612552 RepID=A0AAC9LBK6_9PSEU|nr:MULTISPECIES: GNAT family N-acetyltransferase [Actinoalloteichus]APU14596.1 hypothetical protein UA74_12690 [Actinoalloteichus fjordicus]APU20564.1 hypothetical protein UA75_12770 [Actinoalloteichus sp. GBA129-24]
MWIRPWAVEDAVEVAAITASGEHDVLWAQGRALIGPPRGGEHWRRTLVAEVDGMVAGVGALLSPRFHPRRLWAYVEVPAPFRRRGIGAALVTALRDLAAADGRPLRAKVRPGTPSAAFASVLGLRRVLIEGEIRRLRADRLPRPAGWGRAAALDDPQVAEAYRSFYRAVHPTDPPDRLTVDMVRENHLAAATGAVLVDAAPGRPAGVALLIKDEDWTFSGGSVRPTAAGAPSVARELLCTVAAVLPPETVLAAEVDDSMADVRAASAELGAVTVAHAQVVAER